MCICLCSDRLKKNLAVFLLATCAFSVVPAWVYPRENPFEPPFEIVEEQGKEPFLEPLKFKKKDRLSPAKTVKRPDFGFEGHVQIGGSLYAAVRNDGQQVLVLLKEELEGYRFEYISKEKIIVKKGKKVFTLTLEN